MLLSQGNNRY